MNWAYPRTPIFTPHITLQLYFQGFQRGVFNAPLRTAQICIPSEKGLMHMHKYVIGQPRDIFDSFLSIGQPEDIFGSFCFQTSQNYCQVFTPKTPPPLPWSEIQILTKDLFFGGRPLVSFLLADYIAPMMHYDVLLVLLKAFLIISCGMVLVMRVSVRL